ncbi:MAG: GAF domain-containing protein [Candidatus Omnitrophica bacterium]|nr:GAF domain-containing protein [Candidatus Omnitrophota bacterium]
MTPLASSGLLITLTCFSLAAFIFLRAPRSLLNQLMVRFNVFVGVWGLGTMFAGMARTPDAAIWSWRLAHVGGFPLGMAFYHLSCVMSGRARRPSVKTAYLFALAASLLSVTGLAMAHTQWLFGSLHYHRANLLYRVLLIIWLGIVILGHQRLFLSYRRAHGIERKRLQCVFFAMATGFTGGTSVLLPMVGIDLYPYGNFSIPIYSLLVTYGILKHGLTDTRIVFTRAGLLLSTYLVVLGVPFVLGWRGHAWLEARLGREWWLVPLGLCTALATAGPFAYAYLRRQAEARLLKEQRRYQRTLQLAARGMTRVRNVTKLANLITRIVSRTVRVTHASLLLWDSAHQGYVLRASHGVKRLALQSRYELGSSHALIQRLKEHRRVIVREDLDVEAGGAVREELEHLEAELAIPGLIEDRLIGLLVLGSKLSGAGYSADDLHAFATLANEAAMAVENAMSYEELLKVNEQLKVASERLLIQERLAAAGRFAAGMAHEIKNPLSAIKTFAQYLPEKYADPAFRKKFFRLVQAEIDRINTLVKELSDFAKPAPLQLQSVQLTQLVEDTLSLLSDQCLKQGVEVQKFFGENGVTVQADPQQLKQVILNLFLNSLEAMDRGGRLEVSTQADAIRLLLWVTDTGCGIAQEFQRQVWDPFFTTKERGMGLGLAIVKGIVERHGGQIEISSTPGKGTTVELSLPLVVS